MTNLIAVITFTLATNWVTTSKTFPVLTQQQMVQPVYRPIMLTQEGTITSNTVANIQWEGRVVQCTLSSTNIGTLNRQIPDGPQFNL